MNWLETQAAKLAVGRLKANLGGDGMKNVVRITVLLGGTIAILSGIQSLLSHFIAGDLFATMCDPNGANCLPTYTKCLAQIAAGAAAFSPGLSWLQHVPTQSEGPSKS